MDAALRRPRGPGANVPKRHGARDASATILGTANLILVPLRHAAQAFAVPSRLIRNDYANCGNFEHSLPKKVTSRKSSSTNQGSGCRWTGWWSKSREEP